MRPEVVLGSHSNGIDCADSRLGVRQLVGDPGDSTSSSSIPSAPDRMTAMATLPGAGSIPIAGSTAFRPLVTIVGADQVSPSLEVATKTALRLPPAASQSCHVAQMRPDGSTAAPGSGNARKPWTGHELVTPAI